MAQLTIGIDISDDLLSGVVVAGKGKDCQVVSCASVVLGEEVTVGDALPVLLEQLQWPGGRCVSGLPLSNFSLRNLVLPFKDSKKIEQILPFELEEHLLAPVDEQIIATTVTGETDDGSNLLIASVEKNILQHHLAAFLASDLDPDIVTPSSFALADRLRRIASCGTDFILLYGDISSMTMVICHQSAIVFMRRLSYPERIFHDAVFSFNGEQVHGADSDSTEAVVNGLCVDIQRSIDFFCFTTGLEINPEQVVLAGPMQTIPGFQDTMEHDLNLRVRICDLAETGSVNISSNIGENWQPQVYDRPLALALLGSGRQVSFNFRKDEFAPKRRLIRSKRQIMAIAGAAGLVLILSLGYLFLDYQYLKKTNDTQASQMKEIFKKSFPDVTRIVEPLAQMRGKLAEAQTATVSMPLFKPEKRVLAILSDISSRVPASISMHVSRLVIDQDSVRIKGTTDAFNNVNTIKNLLTKSARYAEVNIVSATKGKGKGKAGIRFEIRLLLDTGEE